MKARVEDLKYLVDMLSVLRNSKESVDESVVSSQRLAFLCMLERDWAIVSVKSYMRCMQDHSRRVHVLFHQFATKVSLATVHGSGPLATYSVEVPTHTTRNRVVRVWCRVWNLSRYWSRSGSLSKTAHKPRAKSKMCMGKYKHLPCR